MIICIRCPTSTELDTACGLEHMYDIRADLGSITHTTWSPVCGWVHTAEYDLPLADPENYIIGLFC